MVSLSVGWLVGPSGSAGALVSLPSPWLQQKILENGDYRILNLSDIPLMFCIEGRVMSQVLLLVSGGDTNFVSSQCTAPSYNSHLHSRFLSFKPYIFCFWSWSNRGSDV